MWNIVNCYAPQTECTEEEKGEFWKQMNSMMQAVPRSVREGLSREVLVGTLGRIEQHVRSYMEVVESER